MWVLIFCVSAPFCLLVACIHRVYSSVFNTIAFTYQEKKKKEVVCHGRY